MLLCSILIQSPFGVLIIALALIKPFWYLCLALLFREKPLICLLSFFLSLLTLPVVAASSCCVSFLFQKEMAFHFSMGSECTGWVIYMQSSGILKFGSRSLGLFL